MLVFFFLTSETNGIHFKNLANMLSLQRYQMGTRNAGSFPGPLSDFKLHLSVLCPRL